MTAAAVRSAPAQPPAPGLFGSTISLAGEIVVWLLVSLAASVAIEWVGMVFWWPDQASAHSRDLFLAEREHLATATREAALLINPAQVSDRAVSWFHDTVWRDTGALGFVEGMSGTLAEFGVALVNTTLLFVTRLTILALATPTFIIFGLVGLADGLIERDLRRWGGGRESGYVFHLATRFIKPAVVWTWVIYLALPFTLNPAFIIVPFALMFAYAIRVSAASFKKHL